MSVFLLRSENRASPKRSYFHKITRYSHSCFLFNFQIIFRFQVGIGFGSSAAIDDIQILQGSCQQSY